MKTHLAFLPRKLAVGLSITAAALAMQAGAAGFAKTQTYDGRFADVPAAEWYASEVTNAFELGLMNGTGDNSFEPNGEVLVSEAVTMASRAAALYAGDTIPDASGEWYQKYVNYALSKGFIAEGQFDSFDRAAKRHEVALIFQKALPADYFTAKNDVADIPDVSEKQSYRDALLTLYRAGVVMGSDSYGNFRPEDNITRAEAAAIINRVALPENRLSKVLDKVSDDDAYTLIYNTSYAGHKEGINSGWRLDNRGGTPRTSLNDSYGSLADISKTEGTAMIREFNKTTTGVVTMETQLSVGSGFDGFSIEYRNEAGNPVYKLVTEDGAWKLENADGSRTTLRADAKNETFFYFRITVDLDNNRSTTLINGESYGTHPLMTTGADTNLLNFRFATSEESTAVATLGIINTVVNYAVYEDFAFNSNGDAPLGWVGENIVGKGGMLQITNGYATRQFDPVSDTVIADWKYNLTEGQPASFALKSGTKTLVSFSNDGTSLYANGEKVYDAYVKNLWYRIRLEADTDTQSAIIWLNGRKIATVAFAENATSVDNIVLTSDSDKAVSFDNIRVFSKKTREDYVPAPVKPAGEEKHIVGMNICSLWRNGTHFGWSCISPYEDAELALGYYDEGNPETADWEIKYMVEHGIDFQAFCWYADNAGAPISNPSNSSHLYDGYMYANYSDAMKYCLIWECANAASPRDLDAWKNYYVPYFMENFFKDERYMSIDNQLVLCVFGESKLATNIGGASVLKEAFDYLEEEVKKLGYDGMIYLYCGSAASDRATMGFDGCYAYNWGNSGYKLQVNKDAITKSSQNTSLYTVPTISVGFNSIPWHGIRYPMMTTEDFKTAHTWVRDEYLPTHAEKGTWQENFSMISTWNEYGEGTYIMPSKGNGGFGYLDALREVYTDEKPDASLNLYPTDAQRARINRLYPQYRHLLRKTGYYDFSVDSSKLESVYTVDYSNAKAGISVSNTKTFEVTEEGLKGMVDGDTLVIATGLQVPAAASQLKLTLDVPKGTNIEVYYTTDSDDAWNAAKGTSFTADKGELATYTVDMSQKQPWKGTITNIRVDPGQTPAGQGDPVKNYFRLVSLEFLQPAGQASRLFHVNGKKYETNLFPEQSAGGAYLMPFDPSIGMDYLLNSFYTWDRDEGKLTIQANGHDVVYTVDKDTYTVDGTSKSLGYTMYLVDGLPALPIEQLCKDLGYTITFNDKGEPVIETNEKEFLDKINNGKPGEWNFETAGYNEGWSSYHMNLFTVDGYMRATSLSDSRDPIITLEKEMNIPAAKYKAMEVRCRYKYDGSSTQHFCMYFTTDSEPSMREAVSIKGNLKSQDSGDEWETYTVDLTENQFWNGIVKQLRFDPFNAVGTMDIDYIRFIEDEDYVDTGVTPAAFEIRNGDAEDKRSFFISDNAAISIVEDPDDKNNHVYLVKANAGKQWTYFRQNCVFTPGKTYKVDVDLRLIGKGEDVSEKDTSIKSSIICNFRYQGLDGKVDHINCADGGGSTGIELSVGDGWKHLSFEYTIPADGTVTRGADQFALYANPVDDANGLNYYVDNIVVQELDPAE